VWHIEQAETLAFLGTYCWGELNRGRAWCVGFCGDGYRGFGMAQAERGEGDVVRVAVDFSAAPADVVANKLRKILELGWVPDRALFQKSFSGEGAVPDVAQEELRAVMGEYWVEGRTA
jgi:hypothetical protein